MADERYGNKKHWRIENLWEIVKDFSPQTFLVIAEFFAPLHSNNLFENPREIISDNNKFFLHSMAAGFEAVCKKNDLLCTGEFVHDVVEVLSRKICNYGEVKGLVEKCQESLIKEMGLRTYFRLTPNEAEHYKDPTQGWDEVIGRFQATQFDIQEAERCLTLGRGTACVFHLMRIMEVGLRALAISLKDAEIAPKTNPSWDAILKKINTAIDKQNGQSGEWVKFYRDTTTMFMAVKGSFRNPTMHVEQVYTEQEALDLLNLVGAFMRHLATKLSE